MYSSNSFLCANLRIEKKLSEEQLSEEQLSEEELDICKEAFSLIDKDGDGIITPKELGTVMTSLGQKVTESVTKLVDMNGKGTIDFTDFLVTITKQRTETDKEDNLKEAFHIFDMDGDAFISPNDLGQFFASIGMKLTDEEVQLMIKEADTEADRRRSPANDQRSRHCTLDGDGQVNYDGK